MYSCYFILTEIGDTIGNLFGSSDKADDTKVEEGAEKSEVSQMRKRVWIHL